MEFFRKAFPDPGSKNFHTQLGVHFEEIAEMLYAMTSGDPYTRDLIGKAHLIISMLSAHLKTTDNTVEITDRTEFLDGLCDQIVTSVGVAHMINLDITGGFGEVNRSNFSKFDDNGNPILDNNLKMVKGPNYFKPNLKPFA